MKIILSEHFVIFTPVLKKKCQICIPRTLAAYGTSFHSLTSFKKYTSWCKTVEIFQYENQFYQETVKNEVRIINNIICTVYSQSK